MSSEDNQLIVSCNSEDFKLLEFYGVIILFTFRRYNAK